MDQIQHGSASGTVNVQPSIGGPAVLRRNISGTAVLGARGAKELIFRPFDEFPEVGAEGILYIDTTNNETYYYDREYIRLGVDFMDLIDDLEVALDKTWSSDKINDEFDADQQQLDNIGNLTAITNSEIEAILAQL